MNRPYEVTHRNYTKDGEFTGAHHLPWDRIEDAVTDANMVLEFYGETEDLQAVGPCNITLRGPDGRFVKWKN